MMDTKFSVVIPTYNSEKTIGKCLKSLAKYYDGGEVIVVDDGSTDKSRLIAGSFGVRTIKSSHGGPAKARNIGWRSAKGKTVVFIDSDVVIGRTFFRRISETLNDNDIIAVQGTYASPVKLNDISSYDNEQIDMRQVHGYTDNLAMYATAIRREYMEKVGGFDEDFKQASGEDTLLSYRLSNHGKMFLNKDAKVYHINSASLWDYMRKQKTHAYWRVLLYRKSGGRKIGDKYAGKRLLVQPILAISIIGLPVVMLLQIPEVMRSEMKLRTLVYGTLRALAWGVGMVQGLYRFILRGSHGN